MIIDNVQDKYIWRCRGARCNRSKKSIRVDSWLKGGQMLLPLTTFVTALFLFCINKSQTEVELAMDRLMSHQTVSVWFNFFREVMSWDMLHNPIMLGGRGHTVQVDESYFSGKRKYHRGRLVGNIQHPWVLGLIDTTTKKVALFIVPDRTGATLVGFIERIVLPNTRIVTDGWGGYRGLAASPMNYTHDVVNHAENFVDPQTGAHTQEIEGFWTHAKARYKAARGFDPEVRANYIDEIQWRWNFRGGNIFGRMLQVMGQMENPNRDYANLPQGVLANKPDVVYP